MWALWSGAPGQGRALGTLRAPGWPAWIGTDGRTIGWAVRDRLFLLDPGAAVCRMVELPDIAEDAWPAADGWVVALGQGFVVVDPSSSAIVAAVLDDDADPVGTRAGRHVGVLLEVPSSRLLVLADGAEVPLPDGANRSRWLTPFGSGVGCVWVDGDMLYRLRGRAPSIAALGRVRGVQEVVCGAEGAVIVRGRSGSLLAAPRGLGVDGPRIDAARIGPDGLQALAVDGEGAMRLDLSDGRVLQRWPGRFDPVGWIAGVPWVLDRALGQVRPLEGDAAPLAGFCGARPGWLPDVVLAGPGGRRWFPDGSSLDAPALRDGLVAVGWLDGQVGLVHADDDVRIYCGEALSGVIADVEADEVAVVDGVVRVDAGDTASAYAADGARLERAAPEPPEPGFEAVEVSDPADESEVIRADGVRWPVPADQAAQVGADVWAWTDDGALAVLVG